MIVLPSAALNMFGTLTNDFPFFPRTTEVIVLITLAGVLLSVIMLWGTACTVLVGRRLIQSKAGRSRSSFAALRREGAHYVLPLLLTGILRACLIILWGILFIIPGVIYGIRTVFYTFTVVLEEKGFRAALRRSQTIVRGRTWRIFWKLVVLALVLYLPANFILWLLTGPALDAGILPSLVLDLTNAFVNSALSVLYTFALILLYGECTRKSNI
ncbi:MAG: hypothetical protein PHS73_01255 [Candidatus Peribacteraceae bacterium]|nr:hypothetical protein [Candidatus Peribacteraceae bacterium]